MTSQGCYQQNLPYIQTVQCLQQPKKKNMQEETKTEKGILKFKRDFRDILTNCCVWT